MNRRTIWFLALVLCAVAAIFALKVTGRDRKQVKPVPIGAAFSPTEVAEAISTPAVSAPAESSAESIVIEGPRASIQKFSTGTTAQKRASATNPELLAVKGMLRDYRAAIGQNPVGNNVEITRALLGSNSRKAQFISPVAKLNNARELVDVRNHPLFFHQISGVQMEVRSAGPDGVLWTSDDEVTR